MFSTLTAFVIFAAFSYGEECSNQNRDRCDDGTDMGPDIPVLERPLGATTWDGSTYPSTKEKAGTVCKDKDMGGTCTNIWTGVTNVVPNGWNDDVSSTYVKDHYMCKFYCDGYLGRYMTTITGPHTVNWINSWNDCISSWACKRQCTKKQDHCSTHTSGCISDTYIKCKTCKTGYLNQSGKCVEDPTCVMVDLTIDEVHLKTESIGVPDEMILGYLSVDNCGHDNPQTSTVSDTKTVSHTVESTYSFSESFSDTMGETMSASVTLTVKGEIVPGFGADVSTSISDTSSWSTTQSSSSSKTEKDSEVVTHVWSHSETITTSPYHNTTFNSIGSSTPGKIQWTGTMKCYNKLNKLTKSKSVTGTYAGATIQQMKVELKSDPCGAPAGFTLQKDLQCVNNEIGGTSDSSNYCGTNWADANTKCATSCPSGTDSECPDGEQCFADLSGCPSSGGSGGDGYPTLIDAQNACQKLGSKCLGVMDPDCDGILDYYLCSNNGTPLVASKAGTCVYKMTQETAPAQAPIFY